MSETTLVFPAGWLIKMKPGEPFEWCRLKKVADAFRKDGCTVIDLYGEDVPALIAERDALARKVETKDAALRVALKAVKLLDKLTACGADDDYVSDVQATISAALEVTRQTGGSDDC